MNEMKSSYLTGFVIGGLIGSAVALVLAPQTGSSTRTRFSNSVATLNRRILHDSSEAGLTNQSGNAVREADNIVKPTTNEPGKQILDEGISASSPPA